MTEPTTAPPLSATPRTSLGRKKDRARTDRADLHDVLDGALICHLGLVLDGHPQVLPTGYGRDGDVLYLHGSTGARSVLAASGEPEVCVAVTLLDGVVYSRTINDHSMNYRSAVIYGRPRAVLDPAEKLHGLRVLSEHLAPGSWEHAREPDAKELAGVAVLALSLAEASVKVRSGPPTDDPAEHGAGAWAGVLPLRTEWGVPEAAPDLADGIPTPPHITDRRNPAG
ncbi:pyridoxamine 5'-phosphate oxidase family protein [Saccharopolyspora sp. NPDC047091]|uniref:pyridoxamine 5'-phosphate oxidase family protein n=1 Tax=Saccharopolyspora sp. NPDC047091 TaxID=3155924 RepID=UPI00340E3EBE